MSNFKKYSIFLVLLIVGILGFEKANAESIQKQQLADNIESANLFVVPFGTFYQTLGTGFTGLIDSFELKINSGVTPVSATLNECSDDPESYGAPIQCANLTTKINDTTPGITNEKDTYIFSGSAFTASTTAYYYIQVSYQGGSQTSVYGAGGANFFPDGRMCVLGAGPSCPSSDVVKDMYFRIGFNLLNENSIVITIPQDGTALPDFGYWGLQYNFATSTDLGTNFIFGVRYGTSSTLTLGILDATLADAQVLVVEGVASTTIAKTDSPPTGVYYAQAFIRYNPDCNDTSCPTPYYVATSTVISFLLTSQGDPFNPEFLIGQNKPTQEACGFTFSVATSTWNTLISCTFEILFSPSNAALNQVKQAVTGFKGFFPFNIFFDFQNTVSTYATAQQGQSGFELDINLLGDGATSTVQIDDTLLSGLIGDNNKDYFFELQRNIIWLATGLFIVFTVL